MAIDFGDTATGPVADENDWTSKGPRIIRPRREVTGTVTGMFALAGNAVKVTTVTGEVLCIRVHSYSRTRA